MYRYRPRAPARGKCKNIMQGMSDSVLVSDGGPLERAIKQDLLALRSTFFEILMADFRHVDRFRNSLHASKGKAFTCFKNAFRLHDFATIYHCCPARCDLDSFSQILYSACLGLLVDASKQAIEAHYVKRSAFAIFALYALYKANPYPMPPSCQMITNDQARSLFPFGVLQTGGGAANANLEDKTRTRRTYKSPIRIDKHIVLIMQQLHDFCLAAVDRCEYFRLTTCVESNSQNKQVEMKEVPHAMNIFQRTCQCAVEYDLISVINIFQLEGLFELCEYYGPGTVEGLVGSRLFTANSPSSFADDRISTHGINEMIKWVKKSRKDWSLSMHVSSLRNATNLYVSSLRAMKPFEDFSSRGNTHQTSLLSKTLSGVSAMRNCSQLNGYIYQLEKSINDLTEVLRSKFSSRASESLIVRKNSHGLLSSITAEQPYDEACDSSGRKLLDDKKTNIIEGKTDSLVPMSFYSILFPESIPCEINKSIETALGGIEWGIAISEYGKSKRIKGEDLENLSKGSPVDPARVQSFLDISGEDFESMKVSSLGSEQNNTDESSVITMVGAMALRSLLSRVVDTYAPKSIVCEDEREFIFEGSFGHESESSAVDYTEGRKGMANKVQHQGNCSVTDSPQKRTCADLQVSSDISIVSGIGRTAIDSLMKATTRSRKRAYRQSSGRGSTLDQPKRNRKRTYQQSSSRSHASDTPLENPKRTITSGDGISKPAYAEHDDSSTFSGIGRSALQTLLSNVLNATSSTSAPSLTNVDTTQQHAS